MLTDAISELKPYLDPSEHLLWSGEPRKGIIFRTYDLFLIPFSLMWCGFAIFWVVMAAQASVLFSLFGIPFVAIGLVFVFGRFIIDARQRANTFYGITNERILILTGINHKRLKSLNIHALPAIDYTLKSDGSGTINFDSKNAVANLSNGVGWWPGLNNSSTFELIPDVKKVFNQILELQKKNH